MCSRRKIISAAAASAGGATKRWTNAPAEHPEQRHKRRPCRHPATVLKKKRHCVGPATWAIMPSSHSQTPLLKPRVAKIPSPRLLSLHGDKNNDLEITTVILGSLQKLSGIARVYAGFRLRQVCYLKFSRLSSWRNFITT